MHSKRVKQLEQRVNQYVKSHASLQPKELLNKEYRHFGDRTKSLALSPSQVKNIPISPKEDFHTVPHQGKDGISTLYDKEMGRKHGSSLLAQQTELDNAKLR